MIKTAAWIQKQTTEIGMIQPFQIENLSGFLSAGLGKAGYDVTVEPVMLILRECRNGYLSFGELPTENDYIRIERDPVIIPPRACVLLGTRERFRIPLNIFVRGFPKSTLQRLGLIIQPAMIEPGFGLKHSGGTNITVEIYNANPFAFHLPVGRDNGIMQFIFEETDMVADPYNGKYQDQNGIQIAIGEEK